MEIPRIKKRWTRAILLGIFDRATAFHPSNRPAQAAEDPLLDTFDRATAMVGR